MLTLTSNCSSIKIHLCDCFRPPVDGDQGVTRGAEAHSGHAATLEIFIENMILEIQVSGQNFDPAVAGVHHEDPVVYVQGEAAGLDEAVLP